MISLIKDELGFGSRDHCCNADYGINAFNNFFFFFWYGEQYDRQFLKKLNRELPHDPAILLLGTCPEELKAGICRPRFTEAKVEATDVSIAEWTDSDGQTWTLIHSLKNERNSDTHCMQVC